MNHLQTAFLFYGSSGIFVQNFPSKETLHTHRDGKLELHWVEYLEPIEVKDAQFSILNPNYLICLCVYQEQQLLRLFDLAAAGH